MRRPVTGMYVEAVILRSVGGHGPDNALTLRGLIVEMDFGDRIIPSLDDLNHALGRLIARGEVAELPGRHFVAAAGEAHPKAFAPITNDEYETALALHQRGMIRGKRNLGLEPPGRVDPRSR